MIVDTSTPYTSFVLQDNINSFIKTYPFLKKQIIGYSVLGFPIYSLILGNGSKKLLYVASTHANEWITTPLLMKFIEDFCTSYSNNSKIDNYNITDIFSTSSIHIVPMLNPDGVNLVNSNLQIKSAPFIYAKMISSKYPNILFPNGWKANIRGVDLKIYQPTFLTFYPLYSPPFMCKT